ncbi:uncharacterized protein LOC116350121 isoform X2 [Contarinia nasturtii]|nr:uncharacterized protein LOC116350121 isoform X2 [Contarinia nasturtii]XP_031637732.1 uncharacterized protein LOC116350121 isoform X2 [Contarinia nasturtii]XP_031637738.1 uncharacterized protein LOC116350121 isoform X2 [Contarinia nasturtii]
MAKEMMIVFVYDTECCQKEEDDPADAVLYFHPTWVSDTQKFSLCGQLMGTVHFLRETFGKANVISLQNGKFVLKEFGRFVLAVGTDRNISQSLLEHRAELLSSLVRLFHCDIQTIYDQFSASGQYKNISEKLYHIFETYLPILQYNGNIFQNMPISKLPKSASNIFLEAMHTLQSCQRTAGVLGGSILYHNKIIATQLYSKLVKNLILTDPHRIKCTAESLPVKFHVPIGCQLITIYIPQSEYDELVLNSERIQTQCANQENGTTAHVVNGVNAYPPIQFKKKIMKRDKSIVFTNIPEEHSEHSEGTSTAVATTSSEKTDTDRSNNELKNNENQLKFTPQPATVRPNHLPLRFKNITSKDIPESGFSSSITFDEQDSFPQFIGRTSVCSTPMTENKVLHGNILPICSNPFNEKNAIPNNNSSRSIIINEPQSIINNKPITPKENKNTNQEMSERKFFEVSDRFLNNTAPNPFGQQVARNSLVDITEAFRKFSKHLSLRPISTGFTNFMHECDYIADGKVYSYGKSSNDHGVQDDLSIDYDADAIDDIVPNNRYRTITDPTYPVFNSYGKPISRFLFDEIVNQQTENDNNNKNLNAINFNSFDDQPQTIRNDLKLADNELKVEKAIKSLEKSQVPPTNNINRKSLSLPLKSLTNNGDPKHNINNVPPPEASNTKNIFDKPEERRKLTGIQLTPLITKLSILAMNDDRSNSFSSWDTTPGMELATPLDSVKLFRRRSSVKGDETDQIRSTLENKSSTECSDDGELKKVELFICGQNNMTMLLVMKENFGQKHEHIQAMFDVCVSKLPRLETNLNQILNVNMNGDKTDGGYSFFCVDQEWDTLSRGGPWSNSDLSSIEYVRHDLQSNPKLHSIIVRGDESVIYAHQNIGANVFYKQSAQSLCGGLPPPVDAMGTISKHARRSLERDHFVILF